MRIWHIGLQKLLVVIYNRWRIFMKIATHDINDHSKTFIIAELSANHGNDIKLAKKTIKAAMNAGADAVKLQTYTPDTMTLDCDNEYFKIKQGTIWDGSTLYDLYKQAYTPWDWHKELFDYAKKEGIIIFSTPFDHTAVDFLEDLNTPAYKIASAEIMDTELIEYVASKGKPIIFSTGLAYIGEIKKAIDLSKQKGNDQIALLKCVSSYPTPMNQCNLKTIPNLRETFGVIVGLSDHTLGFTAPVVAVTLGAKIVEKHFILDKSIGGPDSSFSLDYFEFKEMVRAIRDTEDAIGKVTYDLTSDTIRTRELSRSLFVVKDLKEGDQFSAENIRSIRPGYGLAPKHYKEILNKKANQDIKRGTPLKWSFIKN